MTNLALKVSPSQIKHTCYISYCWPETEAEKGIVQTTLQLVRDLQHIGVEVYCDLTWNSGGQPLFEWLSHHMKTSTSLLVVSSPSYLKLAAQDDTLTSMEFTHVLNALNNPTGITSQSVFYTVGFGSSSTSVHPKFSKVLFANISELVGYYQFLPGLICRMVDLDNDFKVEEWLTNYTTACGGIIRKVEEHGLFTSEERITILQQVDQIRHSLMLETNLRYNTLLSTLTQKDQLFINSSYSHNLKLIGNVRAKQREELQESLKFDFTPPKEVLLEEVMIDNSTSKISDIFHNFMNHTATVMLLQAPPNAGKTTLCRLFATFAYEKPTVYPIMIDLTTIKDPTHLLLEQALEQSGFTPSMVEHIHKRYTLFLLIEGVEKISSKTNLFVRNKLGNWNCKVVFTCNDQFLKNTQQAAYYFMPGNLQKPTWDGLQILSFTSKFAKTSEVPSEIFLPPLSQVAVQTKSLHFGKLHPKQLWEKALQGVLRVVRTLRHTKKFIQILNVHYKTSIEEQGYKMLAYHFIQPHLHKSFQQIRALASSLTNLTPPLPTTAFISYAWPAQETSRISLQTRLMSLVEDMAQAGINVLLDIIDLKPNMDIDEFMREGLESSQVVFLIGTPRLKERIVFQADKSDSTKKVPGNNATIEFDHISTHLKHRKNFEVFPLWMDGVSLDSAFPNSQIHPSPELQFDFSAMSSDLCKERQYYHDLPMIVGRLLRVSETPEFQTIYSNYLAVVKQQEQFNMTTDILQEKWKTHHMEQEEKYSLY